MRGRCARRCRRAVALLDSRSSRVISMAYCIHAATISVGADGQNRREARHRAAPRPRRSRRRTMVAYGHVGIAAVAAPVTNDLELTDDAGMTGFTAERVQPTRCSLATYRPLLTVDHTHRARDPRSRRDRAIAADSACVAGFGAHAAAARRRPRGAAAGPAWIGVRPSGTATSASSASGARLSVVRRLLGAPFRHDSQRSWRSA